jgi:hypothetical protein
VEAFRGPLEEIVGKRGEIDDCRDRVAVAHGHFAHESKESLLEGKRVPVENNLGVDQRRRRNDKALLLDIAKPGFVVAGGGIGRGHAVVPVRVDQKAS